MKNLILLSLLLLAFACDCDVAPSSGATSATSSFGQPPVENVSSIVAGDEHACALLEDEEQIRCWGSNGNNQLELGSAKNSQITLDVSKSRFSKISAGNNFTCGILKDDPHKEIPVCFGKDGGWFHTLPNAPIKDIAASRDFTCFIKNDDTIDCVGEKILIAVNTSIEANILMKHGIKPTGDENKDFSMKKFVDLKAGNNRICARKMTDGAVYCMGHNAMKSSQLPPSIVLDYALKGFNSTVYIDENNRLNVVGLGIELKPLKNISNPETLEYKKISSSFDLITSSGNHYDDGSSIIPENSLIRSGGPVIEGVLDSVKYFHPSDTDKPERLCILKVDKKIVCAPGNFDLFVFP